jgi:hypothetical protein
MMRTAVEFAVNLMLNYVVLRAAAARVQHKATVNVAGLGLSGQKSTARRDHAHRDRRGLFSIHTKHGLLNRLPTKVSFSIFD